MSFEQQIPSNDIFQMKKNIWNKKWRCRKELRTSSVEYVGKYKCLLNVKYQQHLGTSKNMFQFEIKIHYNSMRVWTYCSKTFTSFKRKRTKV